jgi:hypothetical protein
MWQIKTKVGIFEVSTVQLVDGYYETMVFNDVNGDTNVRPEFTRRYDNKFDAEQWHAHVVYRMTLDFEVAGH